MTASYLLRSSFRSAGSLLSTLGRATFASTRLAQGEQVGVGSQHVLVDHQKADGYARYDARVCLSVSLKQRRRLICNAGSPELEFSTHGRGDRYTVGRNFDWKLPVLSLLICITQGCCS